MARACRTTRAPILMSLSCRLVRRPVGHGLGQTHMGEEDGQVVGQRVQLEPHLVVPEPAARQARPADGVLAFADVLLGGATAVVEPAHPLGLQSAGWSRRSPHAGTTRPDATRSSRPRGAACPSSWPDTRSPRRYRRTCLGGRPTGRLSRCLMRSCRTALAGSRMT